MKKLSLGGVLFVLIIFPGSLIAQEIIVHEAWSLHMESAGGWVAANKGFYRNLTVKEVQGGPNISPIQEVVSSIRAGNIAFGVDSPENIIRVHEKEGIDLVAVSVDFQNSAMRIISRTPVRSAKEIRGDFGIWTGYEVKAKCAVGKGWERQFTIQNQGEDINPWLSGTWPLASAMTYNELIIAQREMKKRRKPFYTIDYKDLGIDWMDNVLFTTGEIIHRHPVTVQTVVTGRYMGFRWAFENPRETFDILKKLSEGLDFIHEMDAVDPMKMLMTTSETKKNGFGYVNPKKWKNVARDMFKAGLLERTPDARQYYTEKFSSGVMPK